MISLPLAEIATLGTEVATHGALQAAEQVYDDVFEMMIAVAMLVHTTF